ncbi:MAG: biopolymer transporter ExbD [Opitutales bacterium]|jgi:biopolymer transport protein ExbD|nr:biopolymer transporter ExbD [Opitutales bacterium]MDP4644536.1 biopolymer transporter ExbD [Opitutales bacterium]MDP4878678.1 biopolymer transporter ExbD [Opitutales bacterium]
MSLKGYKVPNEGEEFDLTPMIDVVFLLIVFFMTVASMLTADKIDMNLAVAEESAIPKEIKQRYTFSVLNDGTFYSGAKIVSEAELNSELARLARINKKMKIVVRADRKTEHQHVNKLLAVCAANGINDIIFATYQSDL